MSVNMGSVTVDPKVVNSASNLTVVHKQLDAYIHKRLK